MSAALLKPVVSRDVHAGLIAELRARQVTLIFGRMSPALRQMKYMPEFRFRLDTSYDNMAKIDELLRSPEVARDLHKDDED